MIRTILLEDQVALGYKIAGNELNNLSKINIFIGSNNSGKSRLLRGLFQDNFSYKGDNLKIDEIQNVVSNLSFKISNIHRTHGISDYEKILNQLGKLSEVKFITKSTNVQQQIIDPLLNISSLLSVRGAPSASNLDATGKMLLVQMAIKEEIEKIREITRDLKQDLFEFKKIYIPVLRGLKPIQISEQAFDFEIDNYTRRAQKDYFNANQNLNIYTGLNLYNDARRLLLGTSEGRAKIKSFEDFLSTTFFKGAIINIVPRIDDDVVHIRIGDEERAIHKLGDGIQSIIILTYPLFFNQGENLQLFIEEPELNLHPGFQRIFIETLNLPIFAKAQVFITTHSNHLLDITADYTDTSIYTFQKPNETTFEISQVNQDDKKILSLIGARASSMFLSNCTIWVEGITDRLYFRHFLSLLQKEKPEGSIIYREDYHYSFLEYSGNNITHWSFLDPEDEEFENIDFERICSKVFLIADNDGKDFKQTKKTDRHEELKLKLGDNFYPLTVREIENILSKDIIKKVICKKEGSNAQNLDFKRFNRANHTSPYLGEFIRDKVDRLKKRYAAPSGTLRDKLSFCKTAISFMTSYDDLSQEAKDLCEHIYKFIQENNRD